MPDVDHVTLGPLALHEAKRIKEPVRAASTANVNLSSPGATLDGVTLASGERILLKDQTTTSQNGIYVWTGAASVLNRAADADLASEFFYGFIVYVREGTANASSFWAYTQSAAVTLGVTSITFVRIATSALTDPTTTRGDLITRGASAIGRLGIGAAGTFLRTDGTDPSWSNTAAHFDPSGVTGATAASRYVGATANGAPASGTFSVGDFIVDQTGKFWICTSAGTPGTWQQSSGGMTNPMTTNQDLIVGAALGAPGRLGIGANGQVLSIVAGGVAWANSSSGFSNPMTSVGDMIAGTTAGAALRLPIGANEQVLTVVGGQPTWANNTGGTSLGANASATTNLYLATHLI